MAGDWQIVRSAAPLRMKVVELLREAITTGEFEPGTRLIETPLCNRMGVSRTVIREAIRQLEAEDLVTIIPNRGPVVSVLSSADATALYEVRAALEGLAGTLCAQRADEQTRKCLRNAYEKVRKAYTSPERNIRLAAKDEFYDILMDGAQNPIIQGNLRSIHNRVRLLRNLSLQAAGRIDLSLRELKAIVEAIELKDAEGARIACTNHVRKAATFAISQLEFVRAERIHQKQSDIRDVRKAGIEPLTFGIIDSNTFKAAPAWQGTVVSGD